MPQIANLIARYDGAMAVVQTPGSARCSDQAA